jgi:predicted DNA-binding protein
MSTEQVEDHYPSQQEYQRLLNERADDIVLVGRAVERAEKAEAALGRLSSEEVREAVEAAIGEVADLEPEDLNAATALALRAAVERAGIEPSIRGRLFRVVPRRNPPPKEIRTHFHGVSLEPLDKAGESLEPRDLDLPVGTVLQISAGGPGNE